MIIEPRIISFDEPTHKYTDEHGQVYTSVTTLLGQIKPKFNDKFWLVFKALERQGKKVRADVRLNIIYVDGIPYNADDILNEKVFVGLNMQQLAGNLKQQWVDTTNKSLAKGTNTHNYLEDSINALSTKDSHTIEDIVKGAEQTFKIKIVNEFELENSPLKDSHPDIYTKLVFFVRRGFIIYAEKRVYSSWHLLAGTIDVFVIRGKEFFILDWKTNKRPLKFNSGYFKKSKSWVNGVFVEKETSEFIKTSEHLLAPLNHLENCDGLIYTMQLSIYAYICELWGLKCLGLELIHLRDGDLPKAYDIVYRKLDAATLLDWHYQQIQQRQAEVRIENKKKFSLQ